MPTFSGGCRCNKMICWVLKSWLRRHTEEILSLELKYNENAIHTPLGLCLVARFISQVGRASDDSGEQYPGYYKYLKSCIFEEGEMIAIEGFRSMEKLRNISSSEVKAAIAVMRRLLGSPKPVVRFAAFRALHEVGMAHGVSVWESKEQLYYYLSWEQNMKNYYFGELFKRRERIEELPADAVTQVVKSQTEAPAADNLRRRRLL